MAYSTINYALDNHVLTITLNRPEQMNAFTVTMADELVDAFKRASADDEVRAVVVTGAGKAFCAGMDLSVDGNVFGLDETLRPTMEDMENRFDDPDFVSAVRDTGGLVTLAIYDCTKPVIGAINGAAVGIGATMTLAMDIRLMSEKARIGFVFNKIGITPEACSTWFLPRIVGISKALEWTYSAEILSAEQACEGGLVKEVVSADQLLDKAYAMARHIADNASPVAIAMTRQMMYRNAAMPHPRDAHKVDSLAIFYQSLADGREGVNSFLEKRAPQFRQTAPKDLPDFYPWWD
ncbi:crotonase/enoyl-CoA hydratase family protein [Pseudomaricurvus alkylphenolicus]|uniref:crotonase/enoyl-CoA hydratase family protein n=1 Tax=Pseudomaricurvus alkylphenolicus TaxID=1306991 RepID=UPI00141E35A3|nr:crotonase/enoyl-CoA hydratase family protein [Pseudomaricurvus alkylphenolicus]NIB41151.1 crotonase/enoyl-CoA hydratase family protein [Pseudomaricurvus alkylphenolicus]